MENLRRRHLFARRLGDFFLARSEKHGIDQVCEDCLFCVNIQNQVAQSHGLEFPKGVLCEGTALLAGFATCRKRGVHPC